MSPRQLRLLSVFQPPEGGVPEHVLRLVEGLAARDWEIVVAGPAGAAVRPGLEAAGARFEPLEIVGNAVAPRTDAASARALRRLLGAGSFDLLHVHGQKAGLVGRLAARGSGVPAVYTPHGLIYRTHAHRPRATARIRYRITLAAERGLGRRTAAIIAVAEAERRDAIADALAPAERIHTIYNGVAPDTGAAPDPELTAFRGDGPLLGFVAGLREQKGLPTLLDALERLAARGAAPRFAIVGNGPLRGEVERRVAASSLAATTLVTGFGGRVEPYLRALDAFVLPSYWEGMPIAVLEAMAMGLPIVASAVDGVPEAVRDGVTGLLVAPRDPGALAGALERIAGDTAARVRMGAAGAADAAERFTLPRMTGETAALLEAVARR